MLNLTDRHCRYFYRLFSSNILLYTEMISVAAILFGNRDNLLKYNPKEHPLAIQLAGSDSNQLLKCTKICADFGYDEVNLNIGCPSQRVQNGNFGACLMSQPELVAECIYHMNKINIPLSIKTRLGLDEKYSYSDLNKFVRLISDAGCKKIIIHARKAKLSNLNPKKNRALPLNYEVVYKLKKDFPELSLVINGNIESCEEIKKHLKQVDGVMIGRKIYSDPCFLSKIDKEFYNSKECKSYKYILDFLLDYIEENKNDTKAWDIMRHTLGLFKGTLISKKWRRYLSNNKKEINATEIYTLTSSY